MAVANMFQTELRALGVELGLGEFKADIEPHSLNISGLASRAKELAPGLWHFMQDVIRSSSADDSNVKKGIDSHLFMICMILAHLKAPSKNGSFHTMLGIHLHSMGVKRRAIDLLASLGITVTYPTIIRHSNTIANIAAVSQRPYTKP